MHNHVHGHTSMKPPLTRSPSPPRSKPLLLDPEFRATPAQKENRSSRTRTSAHRFPTLQEKHLVSCESECPNSPSTHVPRPPLQSLRSVTIMHLTCPATCTSVAADKSEALAPTPSRSLALGHKTIFDACRIDAAHTSNQKVVAHLAFPSMVAHESGGRRGGRRWSHPGPSHPSHLQGFVTSSSLSQPRAIGS